MYSASLVVLVWETPEGSQLPPRATELFGYDTFGVAQEVCKGACRRNVSPGVALVTWCFTVAPLRFTEIGSHHLLKITLPSLCHLCSYWKMGCSLFSTKISSGEH